MALEHLVLGLVASGVQHGYAIERRIARALGGRGTVQRSHVYAALRGLEGRGFVAACAVRPAGRPGRRTVATTPSGARWLGAWLDREPSDAAVLLRRTLLIKSVLRALLDERPSRREIGAERALRRQRVLARRATGRTRDGAPGGDGLTELLDRRACIALEVELWLLDRLEAPRPLAVGDALRRRRPGSASR